MHRRSAHPKRGLTLVETCVVLAILSVVMIAAAVNFRQARAARELDAAAHELRAALVYGRQVALAGSSVMVDLSASSWQVRTDLRTMRAATLSPGLTLTVPPGKTPLVFSASGSVSPATTLTLSSSNVARTATLTLASSTGACTLRFP